MKHRKTLLALLCVGLCRARMGRPREPCLMRVSLLGSRVSARSARLCSKRMSLPKARVSAVCAVVSGQPCQASLTTINTDQRQAVKHRKTLLALLCAGLCRARVGRPRNCPARCACWKLASLYSRVVGDNRVDGGEPQGGSARYCLVSGQPREASLTAMTTEFNGKR